MDPDAVCLVELNNSRSAAVNQAAQLVIQKVRFSFCLETIVFHFVLKQSFFILS
jgi:hypothetical protein